MVDLSRNEFFPFSRPGGELNPGEDEVEGLKRLLTEVSLSVLLFIFSSVSSITRRTT